MKLYKLEALLGAEQVTIQTKYKVRNKCFRSDNESVPAVSVKSIEELTEVLKLATLEKWKLAPVGGGTKLMLGNPFQKIDFFLSLEQINSILEHEAADLTTTVQAGCCFASFQSSLGKLGQYLPLNPPFADQATLGGIIATNSYGTMRLACGTIRDWLIGIKVVTADGQVSKAGGKVVKNVAGYDLMKLYTGSFGTLSVIVEASFKLRPKPLQNALVLGVVDFSGLDSLVATLLQSQLQPISLELLNYQAAKVCFPTLNVKENQQLLIAQFAGSPEAIKYQTKLAQQLWVKKAKEINVIYLSDNEYIGWEKLLDFKNNFPSLSCFRAIILPSKTIGLVNDIEKTLSTVVNNFALLVHIGNGVIRGFIQENEFFLNENLEQNINNKKYEQILDVIKQLRALSESLGGSFVLEDDTFYNRLDSWGTPPESIGLMKKIKCKLDPLNLLNPGRFVGGI